MTDDRLETFEAARAEGIRDTVKFIMERNPGMTWEQAEEEMRRQVDVELAGVGVEMARALEMAYEDDCIERIRQWREPTADEIRRRAQRSARRTRMARKRRRGWA